MLFASSVRLAVSFRPDHITSEARRGYPPPITLLVCGVCVAVYFGLMARDDHRSWDTLANWGYLTPDRVGWRVLGPRFLRVRWHVAFNVYWLWVLGGVVERTLGRFPYDGMLLAAAVISSSVQLGISGSTGHGASGVVYALFGPIWASRKAVPAFSEALKDTPRHCSGPGS